MNLKQQQLDTNMKKIEQKQIVQMQLEDNRTEEFIDKNDDEFRGNSNDTEDILDGMDEKDSACRMDNIVQKLETLGTDDVKQPPKKKIKIIKSRPKKTTKLKKKIITQPPQKKQKTKNKDNNRGDIIVCSKRCKTCKTCVCKKAGHWCSSECGCESKGTCLNRKPD